MALATAATASAQEPTLDGVGIAGSPVVGSTLQAVTTGTVDPSAITYAWCHQRDDLGDRCAPGRTLGTSQTYVTVPGDVGQPLIVKATADIARLRIPVPGALRLPPIAQAIAGITASPVQVTSAPTAPITAAATSTPPPPYLRPFPVVRVRGIVAADGARITLLRVTAPRGATVLIRCAGDGCPLTHRARHAGRIRSFERFLPAGLRITVRVISPGHIGKYARLLIRAGKPPARRDACVLPGDKRAASCPPG